MSDRMLVRLKKTAATVCVTAVAAVAVAAPANAQAPSDGLINVTIGDITFEDVAIGLAASLAANVCGVQVGPLAVAAVQVDQRSVTRAVCEGEAGDVVFTQNVTQ
jgi:hypothetical protein